MKSSSPSLLLRLPDAILLQILSQIPPQDLRRLKQTNRKLSLLCTSLLHHASPLSSLPSDIFLTILDHLPPSSQTRLARTSSSFYPVVSDFILRQNISRDKSSLLYWAVKKNEKILVKRLVGTGADINTEYGFGRGAVTMHFCRTPLIMAVSGGHTEIVELLLELGAGNKSCGHVTPLSKAIGRGDEDMALLLLQHLSTLKPGIEEILRGDTLKEAADAKLVRVVAGILERAGLEIEQEKLDEAVFHALRRSYSKKEEEDTISIAEMLMSAGADADVELAWMEGGARYTTRELAATYYSESEGAKALFCEGPETAWAHAWRV
jgi:hypothetical protein